MGEGSDDDEHKKKYRKALKTTCISIVILIILASITLLILWLIYRPSKPEFRVVNVAIYALNLTTPPYLSAALRFTLAARNPNAQLSYHYDRLTAFVSYRDEAITPRVPLPPLSQGAWSTVEISPVIGGDVAVSVAVANGLAADEGFGAVALRLVLEGKLRFVVGGGGLRSRRYGVYVECDVLVGCKNGFFGQIMPTLLGSPSSLQCTTQM